MENGMMKMLLHSNSTSVAVILLAATVGLAVANALAQAPQAITPAMEHRVDAMIAKLSMEQKIRLIGGDGAISTVAEPAIGLPSLKMSDGPMGVRSWGPSTAFAAGINLAACWDTALAQRVGTMLGRDARARGVYFLLGPGMNIYRAPMNGRNFEYFGEDPYLAGQIAAGYINGVQSQGVVAVAKHFAGNNSEYDRGYVNSTIDERTLREIYLPPFEASIKEGQVGAVMNSYNRLNGDYTTQNSLLDDQVLRKDWGFKGILMSDWGATHDGIAAAKSGLDLEMPSGEFMNAATLIPAMRAGELPPQLIDEKVRHILLTAMRFGFFDRELADPTIPLFNQDADTVALQSAEEGMVLLKNNGNLLPLDRKKVRTIAIFGPDAYPAHVGGGGSSEVTAFAPVSFLAGLSTGLTPDVKVLWNPGVKGPEEVFSGTHWCTDPSCKDTRLQRVEYAIGTNRKIFSGWDDHIANWPQDELGVDDRTPRRIEWSGYYIPKKSGAYYFVAAGIYFGKDRFRLIVDGKQLFERDRYGVRDPLSAQVTLEAGKPVQVQFLYWPDSSQVAVGMGVIPEGEVVTQEALRVAKSADVAIVSVGFDPRRNVEAEASDRPYRLPFAQEQLIRAIAAVNSHTIVTITAGGSVATKDWLDQVPALLQTWYGGQEAGTALTKLLFGDVNPSGKLPISWERMIEDNPAYKNYYEQPGSKDVRYAEGIFLGYRYYDKSDTKPLFPFGFGLSYTSFAFSNLTVSPRKTSAGGPVTVSFDVKNTGTRAGADVAEVYVGEQSPKVPRPVKELKGFSRVMLSPGESRHVKVILDRRSLAYWDTDTHSWKVDPGKFTVCVGDSSADVPLQKSFDVE
jgi:beta-glucosidase